MNILGVILARKGSKGIKNKNRLKLGKENLVEISIKNAKKSKLLNKIIFSTDDKILKKRAISMGISAPFNRPKKLSDDKATSFSVLRHAITWLEKNQNWKTDIVVLLQPTTPFRTGKLIDKVIKKLINENSDAALTITDSDYPAYWMLKKKKRTHKINFLFKKGYKFTRRQDTPKCYKPAGMVYAIKKKFLFKLKGMLPQGNTVGVYVKPDLAINIDNFDQYLLAKIKSKNV